MARYSFEDMYKNYEGFIVPSYSILINKSDKISQSDTPIINMIEVDLTAGYEASACNLLIYDGVDLDFGKKTYQVNQFIRDKFKLGNSIEISLGYLKEIKPVFKGIITNIQLEYEAIEGFHIQVECMDVKRLMMNNFRSYQPRKDLKKYSDAVKEVLKKYAKSIDKQNISETAERMLALEQHNQSDYDFLVAIAKKANYAFYIVNNEVFFEEFGKDTNPLMEFHAGDLQSFSREMSLADQISEFTVRANDESNPKNSFEYTAKSFKAIGKGKKGSKDMASSINQNASKTIIDPSVSSAKEAKARAEAELARHAFKFVHGSFKTVGIPELVPGKMLAIKGFGEDYDNDYYIKKVTHHYSPSGYYTKGELGVNKI